MMSGSRHLPSAEILKCRHPNAVDLGTSHIFCVVSANDILLGCWHSESCPCLIHVIDIFGNYDRIFERFSKHQCGKIYSFNYF